MAQTWSLPFLVSKRTLPWSWEEIGTVAVRATEIEMMWTMTRVTLRRTVKTKETKWETVTRESVWTGRMMRGKERRIETEMKDMLVALYVLRTCLQRHPVKERGRKRGL